MNPPGALRATLRQIARQSKPDEPPKEFFLKGNNHDTILHEFYAAYVSLNSYLLWSTFADEPLFSDQQLGLTMSYFQIW
jgi:hypothetical protein